MSTRFLGYKQRLVLIRGFAQQDPVFLLKSRTRAHTSHTADGGRHRLTVGEIGLGPTISNLVIVYSISSKT